MTIQISIQITMENHLGAETWLAAGKVFREGAEVVSPPRAELEGGIGFETCLKLGKLQCKSNFNRN